MSTCLSYDAIRASLRPASFGGTSFYVDSTSEDYGVRAVVHEFPNSDRHFTENLGRSARKISVDGYFAGHNWLSSRDAMIMAAESGRPRTLRHPFYSGFKSATCLSFSVTESRDELGVVRFTAEFVEELAVSFSGLSSFIPHLIQTGLDTLIGSAVSSFSNSLNVRNLGDGVRDIGVSKIQGWCQSLDGARIISNISDGGALSASIGSLFDAAEDVIGGAVDIGGFITPIVSNWRDGVTDLTSAAAGLESLIFEGASSVAAISGSASFLGGSRLGVSTDRLFRRVSGGLFSEFTVKQSYRGSREATVARNKLVRWIDSEAMLVDPHDEPQVYEDFGNFTSKVVSDMEQKWLDSAPVVDQQLPRPVSAVALATKLYGDPNRASEIWERNPSPSMSRIGPNIEVLAR